MSEIGRPQKSAGRNPRDLPFWKWVRTFVPFYMHNHWFTLFTYWRAVSPRLEGAKLTQAFTYEKNQCSFILLQDRDRLRVDYSGRTELPYGVLKDQINIPRKRVNIFPDLEGHRIRHIGMVPADRVLEWRLTGDRRLYFEFYGRIPNIYVTDEQQHILDSFKDRGATGRLEFREFSGLAYPLPKHPAQSILPQLEEHAGKTVRNALTAVLPHWTNLLAREAVHRAGFTPDTTIADLSHRQLTALVQVVIAMFEALTSGDAYISILPKPFFSLLELQHLPEITWDYHLPVSEAYPRYIGEFYRGKRFRELQSSLQKILGNRIERVQRRIEKQEADLDAWKDPGEYRKFGDLLMAQGGHPPRERDHIVVTDIIDTQEEVTIPLQPELSVIENAQAYYEKAKKSGRGQEQLQEQIRQSREELDRLLDSLEEVKQVSDLDALRDLEERLADLGISPGQSRSEEPAQRRPFTSYVSPDGWRVLVGRTARDNDELTFHVAHKEDFWFHAEHVPGSHVIVVPDNKRVEKPPRKTLEYAAALAAGHSQAKHSSLVPVVFTKRKYVTKPRDAGPGQVRYQFEESVMVEPRTR